MAHQANCSRLVAGFGVGLIYFLGLRVGIFVELYNIKQFGWLSLDEHEQ